MNMHQEGVKFSIIIPAYNVESWIRECMDSVFSQSYGNWEAVIVEDCSTDNTLEICKELAALDERVRIIQHSENGGLSAARNTGIDEAHGDYIVFLDPDDLLAPCALARMAELCAAGDLDVLRFSASNFAEDKSFEGDAIFWNTRCTVPVADSGVVSGRDVLVQEGALRPLIPAYVWMNCYKKEFIDNMHMRFIPKIVFEDTSWTFPLLVAAPTAQMIEDALYLRRLRKDSIMTARMGDIAARKEVDYLLDYESYRLTAHCIRELIEKHWSDEELRTVLLGKYAEVCRGCFDAYRDALLAGKEIDLSKDHIWDITEQDIFDFAAICKAHDADIPVIVGQQERLDEQDAKIAMLQQENENLVQELSSLKQEHANQQEMISAVMNSVSFKFGRAVTAAPRNVRDLILGSPNPPEIRGEDPFYGSYKLEQPPVSTYETKPSPEYVSGRPSISVLVPIFNVEKYLRECFDSLRAQTFEDFEVICINDGSTDSSLDIIHEYMDMDKRFTGIDKENSGYGASMNQGLDRARGEYIAILESDDFYARDALECMYKAAKADDLDLVKADFNLYWSTPDVIVNRFNWVKKGEAGISTTYKNPGVFFRKPSIWSAIYRRTFLNDNNIRFLETPGASYQDASFNFKVWTLAPRFALLDKVVLYYRQDNEKSSINSPGKMYCVCDEYDEMTAFLEQQPSPEQKRIMPILVKMRYDSYMWNYDRLSESLQKEFLEKMSQDFNYEDEHDLINYSYFEPWKAADRRMIMDDPELFHATHKQTKKSGKLNTVKELFDAGGLPAVAKVARSLVNGG